MPKVVVSDSMKADGDSSWGPVETVTRNQAAARIAELKARSHRDLLVFGSHVLWNELLAQGLVDELHLIVGPVALGEGIRAFDRPLNRPLRLLTQRRLEGSSSVLLQYAC